MERADQALSKSRLPKWFRVILLILIALAMLAVVGAIICGIALLATYETESEKIWGIVLLSVGLALFLGYVVFSVVRYCNRDEYETRFSPETVQAALDAQAKNTVAIGQKVFVQIDRPLGSVHPVHDDIVYELNYGFVPGVMAGDGEYQDAYVLGVDEPLEQFNGVLIAIIHRHNDVEDKWVVAPEWYVATDEEIIEKTYFQEKYFSSTLIR